MPDVYHFTHGKNITGILATGELQCHSTAATAEEVADAAIKRWRTRVHVACGPGGRVCDYVPFYFAPRSPMLFRIHRGGVEGYVGGQRPLVYFVSSTERLIAEGLSCVFTDGNAAAAITSFHDDFGRLRDVVDWPLMRVTYWNDTPEDGDRERRRQAELLVHDAVPLGVIESIGTHDATVADRVKELLARTGIEIPVVVRRGWYFQE